MVGCGLGGPPHLHDESCLRRMSGSEGMLGWQRSAVVVPSGRTYGRWTKPRYSALDMLVTFLAGTTLGSFALLLLLLGAFG